MACQKIVSSSTLFPARRVAAQGRQLFDSPDEDSLPLKRSISGGRFCHASLASDGIM